MKVTYIAHPIGMNVEGNLQKIIDIIREINIREPGTIPFAPYYADCIALDDSIREERERGISNSTYLLTAGFIDELRLYGNRISPGMMDEIRIAKQMGIFVRPMTTGTRIEYAKLNK